MGNKEKEVWEGLKKEGMDVRQVSINGDGIWSRDMGVERKGENGQITEEVFEMGNKNKKARIHGKGRDAKRKVEREDRKGDGKV